MSEKKLKVLVACVLSVTMSFCFLCGSSEEAISKENITDEAGTESTITDEAVTCEAVTNHVINEKGDVEFVITRDKESYEFGEEIVLTIKATNVGDEEIVMGSSVCSMKAEGCLASYLADSDGSRITQGLYMQNGKIVEKITEDTYEDILMPGESVEGQQTIRTNDARGREVGEYSLIVELERSYYKYHDLKNEGYYISVPVMMTGDLGNAVTSEAVGFEQYGIMETITDEEQAITFVVIRDKECYRFGDEILLAIKAMNHSNHVIELESPSITFGAADCLNSQLQSTDGSNLFHGCYMQKRYDYYVSGLLAGSTVPYYGQLVSGEAVEGYQCIQTSYDESQMEGDYNIIVSLEGTVSGKAVIYSVSIPVHMTEGEAPEDIEIATPVPSKEPWITQMPVSSPGLKESENPQISENVSGTIVPPVVSELPLEVANGDTDGNGTVDLNDAQLTLKAALKIEELCAEALLRADVTNDKEVTLEDAQKILRLALIIEEL